jgi:hypothetical protein
VGRGRVALRLLPCLLALLPLAAYAPAWATQTLLAPGDGAALHFPLRSAVWQAYRRGDLPSWNPSLFLGTPLLGSYRPGALHPLMPLLALLPDFAAFQALVLLSMALAGPLLYLYLRRLGAEPVGAYVGGLCFAFGPYLVGHLGDTATLVAAPLLPLLLLLTERWMETNRARAAALVAVAVALLLLAGSPEAARAGGALLGGRVLVGWLWPGRAGRPSAFTVVLAGLGGLLLAAPALLPALLAAREAGRPLTGLAARSGDLLPGLSGLVLRYASHSPAPALALAAVPLLARQVTVRVLGLALAISLLLQWGRGPLSAPGALALVFDLSLAVLAGLCLSAQWRQRRTTRGARLRALFLVTSLASATALSVAAAALGPLPQTLAGAVGTLALALVLYFANADAASPVKAGLWLLPLTVSFLLQPHARAAWTDAPTAREVDEGTGTRQAIDRALGAAAAEPMLTLVREWPGAAVADLAYGGLAQRTGRRNVNGYDPMVPLRTRAALGTMSVGGILPADFYASDPGRLELLGIRWVQVPGAALRRTGGREPEAPPLPPLEQARFFPFPMTAVRAVRVVSSLVDAIGVAQGQVVATLHVRLASGRGEFALPLRAGVDTAEWAWDRADVREAAGHQRPAPAQSWPVPGAGFSGHHYRSELALPGGYFVDGVRLTPEPGPFKLRLVHLGLVEAETGRLEALSPAASYVSDAGRFQEVVATPTVRLFEVRRTQGPARMAARLRTFRDDGALLMALARPSALGVDPVQEALVLEKDAAGLDLAAPGRAGRAALLRHGGNEVEARAEGPGILVLAESWDPGWTVEVDGRPGRLLRVNHAETAVPLGPGLHRVVLRYHARGFVPGLVAALAAALALLAVALRAKPRSARLTAREGAC